MRHQINMSFKDRWMTVGLVVGMLGIWECLSRTGQVSALFFPAPSEIVQTLIRQLRQQELTPHLLATLTRVGIGFAVGGGLGLFMGLLMGWSARLRRILDPLFAAIHPIPKTAIFPLIMLIFGIGETPKLVLVAIVTFFPMLINTTAGVSQIPPIYFEVAKNYQAGLFNVFRRVIIPGSLPFILTGTRLALNTALVLTIVVEMIMAQRGLGAVIWFSWETLRTDELYASLFMIALVGNGVNLLLSLAGKWLLPWQVDVK